VNSFLGHTLCCTCKRLKAGFKVGCASWCGSSAGDLWSCYCLAAHGADVSSVGTLRKWQRKSKFKHGRRGAR
jgi:hypothetical protein